MIDYHQYCRHMLLEVPGTNFGCAVPVPPPAQRQEVRWDEVLAAAGVIGLGVAVGVGAAWLFDQLLGDTEQAPSTSRESRRTGNARTGGRNLPSKNTHIFVRNIRGTSNRMCGCRTWLGHWSKATGTIVGRCSVLGCGEPATVGAHVVQLDGRASWDWWIVPTCHGHNHYSNDTGMWLKRGSKLASANARRMGCG